MAAHNTNVEVLVRCYKGYWVWKGNGKLLMKFSPRRRANEAAKRELGRESSRGKVLCSAVKHWYRNVSM